jgi:hypothetical protein
MMPQPFVRRDRPPVLDHYLIVLTLAEAKKRRDAPAAPPGRRLAAALHCLLALGVRKERSLRRSK